MRTSAALYSFTVVGLPLGGMGSAGACVVPRPAAARRGLHLPRGGLNLHVLSQTVLVCPRPSQVRTSARCEAGRAIGTMGGAQDVVDTRGKLPDIKKGKISEMIAQWVAAMPNEYAAPACARMSHPYCRGRAPPASAQPLTRPRAAQALYFVRVLPAQDRSRRREAAPDDRCHGAHL